MGKRLRPIISIDAPRRPPLAGDPYGLAWDGSHLWCADDYMEIYELETDGNIVSSFDVNHTALYGLTWDGSYLWASVYDPDAWSIIQLETDGTEIDSFAAPGSDAKDLTWDGSNLWGADEVTGKVYKFAADGSVISSFDAPNEAPRGLTWDGSYLYITDGQDGPIDKTEADGTLIEQYTITGVGEPIESEGLTWDGTNLWCVNFSDDKINKLGPPGGIDMYTDPSGIIWSVLTNGEDINVRYRTAPHATWSSALTVATGGTYDNAAITGAPDGIIVQANDALTLYQWHSEDGGDTWTDDGVIS